jgi:hypothetical protein
MSFPPGLHVDPSMILHGEQVSQPQSRAAHTPPTRTAQSIEILQDFPCAGSGVLKGRVLGLYDKGKGALMTTETTLVDSGSGAALCKMTAGACLSVLGAVCCACVTPASRCFLSWSH